MIEDDTSYRVRFIVRMGNNVVHPLPGFRSHQDFTSSPRSSHSSKQFNNEGSFIEDSCETIESIISNDSSTHDVKHFDRRSTPIGEISKLNNFFPNSSNSSSTKNVFEDTGDNASDNDSITSSLSLGTLDSELLVEMEGQGIVIKDSSGHVSHVSHKKQTVTNS